MSVRSQSAWTKLPRSFSFVRQMRFHDRNTGFILTGDSLNYSDTLLRTTDGGVSWSEVSVPLDRPFHLLDFYLCHDTAWLSCVSRIGQTPVRLVRSTNVGASWDVLPMDSSKYPSELCFQSSKAGYVNSWIVNSRLSDNDSIFFTSNGGDSWVSGCKFVGSYPRTGYSPSTLMQLIPNVGSQYEMIRYSTDYGCSYGSIDGYGKYCYAGNRVWVANHPYSLHGTEIARTTDDGETWTLAPGPLFDSFEQPASDTTGDVYIHLLQEDSLFVSHDRGVTWNARPFYPIGFVRQMEVVDSLYAYAIGGGVLYKTTTGSVGAFDEVAEQHGTTSETFLIQASQSQVVVHNGAPNTQLVIVSNLLGMNVLKIPSPHSTDFTLDLTKFAEGTYFLQFFTPEGMVMRKIVLLR